MVQNLKVEQPFLVFGRAGLDLYADPPGTEFENAQNFSSALGGSAANIAAGIAKLGGAVSLLTTVSSDAVGRFVLQQLQRFGIGAEHVKQVKSEARTSLAVVETRAENCQSVIYRNNAADFDVTVDDIDRIAFTRFNTCVFTGTSFAIEPSRSAHVLAMQRARNAGATIVLDVDYRPYSWTSIAEARHVCAQAAALCDIVVGNDEEFEVLAETDGLGFAENLSQTSAKCVVYKMGSKGAVTFSQGRSFKTSIFPVVALKPTGAGDAFMAGLVMSLATGQTLESAVKRGAACAAIVVTRVGCAPACPTLEELETFLVQQGSD